MGDYDGEHPQVCLANHTYQCFHQLVRYWPKPLVHLKGNIECISSLLEHLPDDIVQFLNIATTFLSTAFLPPQHPLKQVHAVLHSMVDIFLMGNHNLVVILTSLQDNSKTAVPNADPKNRTIRFLLKQTITHRILMFLLMFLQIAHIKIFLVASFYLTDIFLPPVSVFQMDLHVLFQVCGCCE